MCSPKSGVRYVAKAMAPPLPLHEDRWRLGRMSVTGSHKNTRDGHSGPDHAEIINESLRRGFMASVFSLVVSIAAAVTVGGTQKVCPHFTTNRRSEALP